MLKQCGNERLRDRPSLLVHIQEAEKLTNEKGIPHNTETANTPFWNVNRDQREKRPKEAG